METGFEQGDWDSFSDVIVEIMCNINPPTTAKYFTDEALHKFFEVLPSRIKFDAYEWGMGDTVFRDNACEWLEKNWNNVERLI